jgi:hypothetical protein
MAAMRRRRESFGRGTIALATLSLVTCLTPVSLAAHDRKTAGRFQLTIGWADEPAFSGSRNAVVVAIADSAGPVKEAVASLTVEIGFGGERISLPLERDGRAPHEYRAWLVPTRAGTYTFHVTGRVHDQPIDVMSTCSEQTFHCVADASEIQFPARDPSNGQLAERISRALPRSERAAEGAVRAQWMAGAALALSGLVAIAVIAGRLRRSRTPV